MKTTPLIEFLAEKIARFRTGEARGINPYDIKVFVNQALFDDLIIDFNSLTTSQEEVKEIIIYGIKIFSSEQIEAADLHFSIHKTSMIS